MSAPVQEHLANPEFAAAILRTLVSDVSQSVLVVLAYSCSGDSNGRNARAIVYHSARLRPSFVLPKPPRERPARRILRPVHPHAVLPVASKPFTASCHEWRSH